MSTSTRGFEHRYYKQRVCYIMRPTVIVNKEQKYVRFDCILALSTVWVCVLQVVVTATVVQGPFDAELLYQI